MEGGSSASGRQKSTELWTRWRRGRSRRLVRLQHDIWLGRRDDDVESVFRAPSMSSGIGQWINYVEQFEDCPRLSMRHDQWHSVRKNSELLKRY
jgi:hypothetical protein